jgi:hypothetical protein
MDDSGAGARGAHRWDPARMQPRGILGRGGSAPSSAAGRGRAQAQLRFAAVTMAAALSSYGCALALEHAAHLHTGVLVLAVVLAVTLSRTDRAGTFRQRLQAAALLPVVAVAAREVGTLLVSRADLGDTLFVAAVAGSIWLRRFGPGAARAGTLIALPFIALLTTPAAPGVAREGVWWAAVIGLIACGCVALAQWLAARTGFIAAVLAPAPGHASPTAGGGGRAARGRRLPASTRMAIQMAAALALAFAGGRWLFGVHWPWPVLSAFVVCSGNRGREDVLHKSGLRLAGAATGTAAATLLAGRIAPGSDVSVVLIFVLLGLAVWLRGFSYAYWATGVTGVLALLYGYYGQNASGLLPDRLEGILLGAALGVAVSWTLLPVRTSDVLRRRTSEALAALSEVVRGTGGDPRELSAHALRFEHALTRLEEIGPPLRAQRALARLRGPGAQPADVIDAASQCRAPVGVLVACCQPDGALIGDDMDERRAAVAALIVATRRSIGGREQEPGAGPREPRGPLPGEPSRALAALAELESAVAGVWSAVGQTVARRAESAPAPGETPAATRRSQRS